MPRTVIAFSGGMDSATVLAYCLSAYRKLPKENQPEVLTVGFTYGSKHNKLENMAAECLAAYYQVPFTLIDISSAFASIESNLMKSGGAIPEGHYEHESMKKTVVPGRNMIFTSILAGIAACGPPSGDKDFNGEVLLGIHAGDRAIYPDCRPAWYQSMRQSIHLGTTNTPEGKIPEGVDLGAPFLTMTKAQIVGIGLKTGVPYEMTRTCYTDSPLACGKCGSCVERKEAFAANNAIDPLPYS